MVFILCDSFWLNNESLFGCQGDIPDIIDVPEPDKMKEQERRMSRIANEDNCFSPDHYL